MPLIVAAGMARSGSTWLFNAIRLLLDRSGGPLFACWIDERDEEAERHARNVVIKIHSPCERLASQATAIFTSHRDLRDIALSASEMGWALDREGMIDIAYAARVAHEFWAPRSKLDLRYADIISAPTLCIARIAFALELAIDNRTAKNIVCAINQLTANLLKGDEHDRINLLHLNHRFDGRPGRWIAKLDPTVAQAIEQSNKDWLTRCHFL